MSSREPTALAPSAAYAALQQKGPISAAEGMENVWIVVGHSEARQVLRDPRFSSDPTRSSVPDAAGYQAAMACEPVRRWFMFRDGDEHRRLRQLVDHHFTASAVEELQPFINATARELVSSANERIELLQGLAVPLVGRVVCRLLGLPESIMPELNEWIRTIDTFLVRSAITENVSGGRAAIEWLRQVIEQQTSAPAGSALETVLAARERGEIDQEDVVSLISLLLYAGFATTTTFISNAVIASSATGLLGQLAAGQVEAGALVDELLRFDSSVPRVAHFAIEDLDLNGHQIKAGDVVILILGAANHDPKAYGCPHLIDPGRDGPRPLTFGFGSHYCLGSRFARAETIAALTALAERWALNQTVLVPKYARQRGLRFLDELYLELSPRPATAATEAPLSKPGPS